MEKINETILSVRITGYEEDKEEFEMLLQDLPQDTLDRLKFFVFQMLIKDKVNYMSIEDLEFLKSNNLLEGKK